VKHLLLACLLATGCTIESGAKSGREGAESAAASVPARAATTSAAPVSAATTATRVAAPAPASKAGPHVHFDGPIKWRTWEDGLAEAKQANRGIFLLVYADWCPHCRELSPVFQQPDVVALAEKLVMVRQDADERAPWLQRFEAHGTYVPRIFFFKPDGTLRDDLRSANPQYPYFYTPGGVDQLKDSMRRAAEG
jgi:thiol:disulfide interchange protein